MKNAWLMAPNTTFPIPVSDVYKRQLLHDLVQTFDLIFLIAFHQFHDGPVSYTHLDVYKRQPETKAVP